MPPSPAIPRRARRGQNSFPEQGQKKEGRPARPALRCDPSFGESDGDYTQFGATVDRLRSESVSRTALVTS